MTFPKLVAFFSVILFGGIAIMAVLKEPKESHHEEVVPLAQTPVEVELDVSEEVPAPSIDRPTTKSTSTSNVVVSNTIATSEVSLENASQEIKEGASTEASTPLANGFQLNNQLADNSVLPEANRIEELFNVSGVKLPIVETIVYKSRVPWQKGRPAWLSDYAAHYKTSRHFIARSLNGKPDYLKQDVIEGNRFNVLSNDKNISFYLLADLSRCKMWLFAFNEDSSERILLKTYNVAMGRLDSSKASGSLTPLGRYQLGSKVATYSAGAMGTHKGQKVEMMQVFGTRWVPFEKEIAETTAPAKGFGLHGTPFLVGKDGNHYEDKSSIGKHASDGCIRLACNDIEELYAIVISRPTTIELVNDFSKAHLPGSEWINH